MKKILVLMTVLAGIFAGCGGGEDDMSSPPASTTTTTNGTATSTNQ